MCIEYHIWVNMYHVSVQGVDERMINVHYYYYMTDRTGPETNTKDLIWDKIQKTDLTWNKVQKTDLTWDKV